MNKVYTDILPHTKRGVKKIIEWKNSIGYKVYFIYNNIQGYFVIYKTYMKKGQNYLLVKYNNNIYNIAASSFKNCKIGNILGQINHSYKYQIGDIINTKTGKIQILEQIKIARHRKNKKDTYEKGYRYKCLICNSIDIINEYDLNRKRGCNVCCNRKIKIGYNDMWTTNPKLASLLANPSDGYKYTQNSNKKVDWLCPNCSNVIKNKQINNINNYYLSCPKCSDHISYPEKFIFNVLQQLLKDNFIYQFSKVNKKWCGKYKYDFYFEINNDEYIIETHGLQHYSDITSFKSCKGRNLQEEQENDKSKEKLAIRNGIQQENYIIIDCRKSELEWIKDNILKSKLNDIFDLSRTDWNECHKYACNSLVKQACDLWNNGIKSTKEIGKIMHLYRGAVINYLKQGNKIKWCNYDATIEMQKTLFKRGQTNISKRKVICLNNNKIFNSITEASKYCQLKSRDGISDCCKGKRKTSGNHPITHERLKWSYIN